ncbi:glycine betaine ABC transporter substrate-binding protein [Chloroflexota bacterium]
MPRPEKQIIKFAELPWDTAIVANGIVTFILNHGYGYESEIISGKTIVLWQGMRQGDIDVQLEVFPQTQLKVYNEALDEGSIVRLGRTYSTTEGWYVPTYVIKGDSSRGIEPIAPDLKTIEDLPKYWELFKDEEVPTKGRLYGGVPGWEAEKSTTIKMETYGLNEYYNMFQAGSDAAQIASMASAYEKGEPWLGYYWAPSWPLAKFNMTRISESVPYNTDLWEPDRACDWPLQNNETAVNAEWLKNADPQIVLFLARYFTSTDVVNKYLLYLQENEAKPENTAMWFLKELDEVWMEWVPRNIAKKVKAALP